MSNEKNLIPQAHKLTVEEQSLGGKASGKKRRFQAAFEKALGARATSAEFKELFNLFGVEEGDRTYADAIACVVVKKAANGDLSAADFARNTVGEKPKEEISLEGGVTIIDDISNTPS